MILNYTTTVDAIKTAAEIEAVLVHHGAKSIMHAYDGRSISGMSFLIDTGMRQIPVKLPVRTDAVLTILQREKRGNPGKRIVATKEQAEKVAWRILKDWVEAQMALIDIHMVQMEEIFLPYIELPGGSTIYEKLEQKQFLLEGGTEDD